MFGEGYTEESGGAIASPSHQTVFRWFAGDRGPWPITRRTSTGRAIVGILPARSPLSRVRCQKPFGRL